MLYLLLGCFIWTMLPCTSPPIRRIFVLKIVLAQGYLAHKKTSSLKNLEYDYAWGPMVVLGGGRFLMSEVPLWPTPEC